MGSHVGAIGLPPEPDALSATFRRMLTAASLVGTSPMGDARVYAYDDASGSRATMTVVGEALVCFTPTFRPGTRLSIRAGSLGASDCDYERPLLGDLFADGESLYPIAVAIEDLAISERTIDPGMELTLEVAALAEHVDVFADEAAYRAGGTPMAVRSLIPSGLFATSQESEPIMPTPRVLMSGEVAESRMLRHAAFDVLFCQATVHSYGADYTVLIDHKDFERLNLEDGPPAGSIVSGTFWLSGRVIADEDTADAH